MNLNDFLVSFDPVNSVLPVEFKTPTIDFEPWDAFLNVDRVRKVGEKLKEELQTEETPENKPVVWRVKGYNPESNTSTEVASAEFSTPSYTKGNGTRASLVANKDYYKSFIDNLNTYILSNPMDENKKDVLIKLAAMESGYNLRAKNPKSTASGYFLFIDSTRRGFANKQLSREEFMENPLEQFSAASKLYDANMAGLKGYEDKIKLKGLSSLLSMYAMWWNPELFKAYLNGNNAALTTKKDKRGNTLHENLQYILNRAAKYDS